MGQLGWAWFLFRFLCYGYGYGSGYLGFSWVGLLFLWFSSMGTLVVGLGITSGTQPEGWVFSKGTLTLLWVTLGNLDGFWT